MYILFLNQVAYYKNKALEEKELIRPVGFHRRSSLTNQDKLLWQISRKPYIY